MIKSIKNLTRFESGLWIFSLVVVTGSFIIGGTDDYLTLIASLIGVTALIFVSKGDVIGQVLTVVFSILYAIISYSFDYYGEMITYLGMTMPIALMSVVSWIRNPYDEKEVKVAHLSKRQIVMVVLLSFIVTFLFYFVLKYFGTTNLIVSTISITTSFLASFFMYLRSSAYALSYAANDIVLIVLWIMASMENISYLPMIICFVMFFINDMYGFFNWRRMKERQTE
ncbi:MAG: nicotinamide mononucleotide transporter [Eubacterium sp.]|nr:nicotinamide mononucleotide transporter [Eubacterium sp.]